MFHTTELQIIHWIHQFRTPTLDVFFKLCDFFDRQEFLFVLVPVLWFTRSWKSGLRIFYVLFLSGLANHALKAFFASPRPFHLDPSLGVIVVKGFGFPSGAAQTVVLLSAILLSTWRQSWTLGVAALYVILVSFSRIYLGVHFPTDILAGWMVGWVLWRLYASLRPPLEQKLETLRPITLLFLGIVVPFALFAIQPSHMALAFAGSTSGMAFGLFLNHVRGWNLSAAKNNLEVGLRVVLGILSLFGTHALLAKLAMPMVLQNVLLGIWTATGVLFLCRIVASMRFKQDA